jgi:hypothetical protein
MLVLPVIVPMAGESEELTMLHYMLYKALSDERTRNAVAAARRHQLTAATIHDSRHATERASRLQGVTVRMVALLNGLRGARARSTVTSARGGSNLTSASGAGPIGCAT